MVKILFVSGVSGNGGTQTWTREYLKSYSHKDFKLIHVNLSARRGLKAEVNIIKRISDGLRDLIDVYSAVKRCLQAGDYPIMHAATSGSLGCLRDYVLIKLAHHYGTKGILHCHYGCISTDYNKSSLSAWLLRKSIKLYDQVWVLDRASEAYLNSKEELKGKVFLTPNFIEVNSPSTIQPSLYKKIAYIGNLIPTKGIFELVTAIKKIPDTELLLVGPGDSNITDNLSRLIGGDNDRIKLLGRIDNEKVMQLLDNIDIMALPTYYPWEAFPISILEAMSHGVLVISCPRAAIPDMLKIDNKFCGILVEPQSDMSIINAINWCQSNPVQADKMRNLAIKKVQDSYTKDIVFERYSSLYALLLKD